MNFCQKRKNFLKLKLHLDMYERKELAYIYLDEEEYENALNLLTENYENEPCEMTAIDLACYYLYEGIKGEDERLYPSPQLAIKALESVDKKYKPSVLLGYAYFQLNDYSNSLKWFEKAREFNDRKEERLNCGLLLYCNGFYEKASKLFQQIMEEDLDNDYVQYCYLFCKLLENGNNHIHFNDIVDFENKCNLCGFQNIDMIDISHLYFLCDCYDKVIHMYTKCMDDFFLHPIDFHIVAYSMCHANKKQLVDSLYNRLLEEYECNFSNPLFDKINELNRIYHSGLYLNKPDIAMRIELNAPRD